MHAKMGLGPSGLPLPVFRESLVGYYNLRSSGNYAVAPPVLIPIDFSQSRRQKWLWVINVEKCKVLFHKLVAGAGYQLRWLNVDTAAPAFARQRGRVGRTE